MVTSKIAPYNGVPTLFVNGVPLPGMAYITYFTEKNRYDDFAAAGVKLFSLPVFFSEQPLNEHGRTPKFADGIFENGEHFEIMDREMERLLQAAPNALVFPRLNCALPRAWELANPDELCDHAVHTVDGVARHRACFSSDAWAKETERLMTRFINYVSTQPYADHIIGYQIAGGNTEEWFSFDQRGSIGKRSREKFAKAVAHGDYTDCEADYYRYLSAIVAQRIDRLAALTKELTNHRLVVGAFYGYTYEAPERRSCHHDMNTLLDSPNVDFYCSPMSYSYCRPLSEDQPNMTAVDSIKQRGKLYFSENDTRTDLSKAPWNLPNYIKPIWFGPDRAASVEMIKKHFARALLHGHAMWWFDMWGGWYDAPEYKVLFPELEKLAEEALLRPRASAAKVAVFVDERALCQTEEPALQPHFRRNLGLSGATYDCYLVDDFAAVASRYRLCIFCVPAETERMTEAIRSCQCEKVILSGDNFEDWEKSTAEWRTLFRNAGVPVRTEGDAVVYENESYLYIGAQGDISPVYDGELEQIWDGFSKLYRKK